MDTSLKRLAILLLAIVFPTMWLHSGLYQLFPPIGWVDPGLYIHWFTSPVENAAQARPEYHGARLPFELVGFALYHLFDPVAAQSCLVTVFYVAGLAGLYLVIARRVHPLPARLAVHWMICLNPIWIAAFVQGYVDGPTIAFGLLALALLLRQRVAPSRLALAGMWLALAISTQPFGGGVAGLSAGAILAVRLPGLGGLKAAFWIACGMALSIVLLGAAGTLVGMPFLYLGVSKAAMSNALAGFDTNYTTPVPSWLGARTRVVIPIITAGLVGVVWVLRRRRRSVTDRISHQAYAVASVMPLMVLALLLAHSAFLLEYRFYASYLLLALAPALTALAAEFDADVPARRWWLVAGTMLGVSLLFAALGSGFGGQASDRVAWPLMAVGFVGFALLAAKRPAAGLVSLAGVLALMGSTNDDTASIFDRPGSPSLRAQQRQLKVFERALDQFGIAPGSFLIWFGRDAFTDERHLEAAELYPVSFKGQTLRLNTLDSLAAATAGWDRSSLGFNMPEFDDVSRQNIWRLWSRPSTVVLLCAMDRDCAAGIQTLTEAGFTMTMRKSAEISVSGAPSFHVVSVNVKRAP